MTTATIAAPAGPGRGRAQRPAEFNGLVALVAIALLFEVLGQVIITGGIDLSSGSVVGATAMIAMSVVQASSGAAPVHPALTTCRWLCRWCPASALGCPRG